MAKGTFKVGGGINPMHLTDTSHPFKGGGGKSVTPKVARSAGAHPTAAGTQGAFKSANAAMKKGSK